MSQSAAKAAAEPLLIREDQSGIARLIMNRPAQRNALSRDLMDAMQAEFAHIAADANVRVVVLAGAGPGFCAGHDLKELTAARTEADRGRAFYEATMRQCSALM
ncbi:MAG: enoyl-CoA hydratase-related protein, partial [Parvibaculum sp.]|uniref:enoyl-CoA hydratase-related protein n=1 Tax=Parvibaculum sp. TaxID=2024848 RepID=UPI00273098C7